MLPYHMNNPLLVGVMKDWVDSFEVCSPGEYRIVSEMVLIINKSFFPVFIKTKMMSVDHMAKKTQPIYTIESMRHLHLPMI